LQWIPVTNELFLHCELDVTSQREAEQKLSEALAKLAAYESGEGELAARISEELRTPLFAIKDIISNAASGRIGDVNSRIAGSLRIAESKVERLTKALTNILDEHTRSQ